MPKPVIAIVSGTRPEIIKLAPVYHELAAQGWADTRWIHTGQHADMADQILRCFDVTPNIRLKREGSALQQFSVDCRSQLDAVMASESFDLCIVQGDTGDEWAGIHPTPAQD